MVPILQLEIKATAVSSAVHVCTLYQSFVLTTGRDKGSPRLTDCQTSVKG
jgi:hypothetical protein